jgi:hypothetical protein
MPVLSGPNSVPTIHQHPPRPFQLTPTKGWTHSRRNRSRRTRHETNTVNRTSQRSTRERSPQNTRLRNDTWTTRKPGSHLLLRKEVIQPHLPVRLPCYDFVPIADPTFDGSLPLRG